MKPNEYKNKVCPLEAMVRLSISNELPITNELNDKLSQIENDISDTAISIRKLKKQIRRNVWVYSKR